VSADHGAVIGSMTIVDLYRLNPMESFVQVFRNLLYDNRLPDWGPVVQCVGWTAVVLVLGTWVFERHQRRLAEVL
jgi:ABC-2 type transport system permease protein